MSPHETTAPAAVQHRPASVDMFVFNTFVHDSRVLKEATALVADGWDVRVIALQGSGLAVHEYLDGFQIERVDAVPWPARALLRALTRRARGSSEQSAFPPQERDAANLRGVVAFSAERAVRRLYAAAAYAQYYWSALGVARRGGAGTFCAHDLDTLPVAAAVARIRRATLVYDSHELFLEQPTMPPRTALGRRKWMVIERHLARSADLVTTVNDSIADQLQQRYRLRDKPRVVRNVPPYRAASSGDVSWRERHGIPSDAPVAVFVGGIAPGRGIDRLVRSLTHFDQLFVALMGPADPRTVSELRDLSADIGVARRLVVLPPVPSAEVAAVAACADVGVVPYRAVSLNHWYSLPTKLFEYLMAGLPVVAGDFPELARIIQRYDVGALCDPNEPASIAAALKLVLSDPNRLAALRENAREAARELCWERERELMLVSWRPLRSAGSPRHAH